ncbi:protein ALTERED PHOSPHATE STARVATION RESPONSE 1-like [Phragmites australis]|uniref:protein ALTERED PHOSPHATE STARVATION RESPONSE 1-like n=1 Tax=Phragmites australis TaxID=29695 RepID=UPI002D796893|nr:protein ALTERED PHOSPHATE STARVATION RESPONSE 1-like [Phragmites australis]
MGCAQSRIENEEAVARCKERRQLMKAAVVERNAFAAAHSAYAFSLRDTGAALSEFAHGEGVAPPQPPGAAAESAAPGAAPGGIGAAAAGGVAGTSAAGGDAIMPPPPPLDSLPPPPPPLPEFSPSPAKIHRSISMPLPYSTAAKDPAMHHSDSIREEDEDEAERGEEEEDGHLDDGRRRLRHRPPVSPPVSPLPPETPVIPQPPPVPKPGIDTWDYFFSMDEGMASIAPEDDEIMAEPEEEKYVPASPPRPPPSPPLAAVPLSEEFDEEPRTPEMVTPPPSLPSKPPKHSSKKKKGKGKLKGAHHQHTESAPPITLVSGGKAGKIVPAEMPRVDLLRVLGEIDERFLKASESAGEVSKVLEANRMHYHSNFVDKRGHIDHSERVMKIITWNRSFKGMQNGDDGKDDFENDELETLATVVDKILAWEKKLYDEVKAAELMKLEYQRKVALLNRQKRHNAAIEVLEKTKAAVTHLHTRYIVDMQSMDSTVSEIQHLRDNQLYPRLLDLADRMAKMWEDMHMHHANQLKTVLNLKSVDISDSNIETSEYHHSHTRQLRDIVEKWNANFNDLMSHQKEYINALYSWLKLNLIPIESSLKEKVASPPRMQQPPIKAFLQAWNEHLTKLPDDLAKAAIVSFRAVLDTILGVQDEELKQKEICEQTRREYMRKAQAFEDWYHKHSQRRTFDVDSESREETGHKDAVTERKFVVESLKSKLDGEIEAHNKLSKQVREKSLSILKAHLPELFRALADFSHVTFDMYSKLRLMSLMQDQGNN